MKKSNAHQQPAQSRNRQSRLQYIPLCAAVVLLFLSGFMFYEAFHFNGLYCDYQWIDEGGVFSYNNIHIFGISLYWVLVFTGLAFTFVAGANRCGGYGYKKWFGFFLPAFFFLESLFGAKILFAVEKVIESGSFKHLNFSGQSLFGSLYLTLPLLPLLAVIFKKNLRDLYDFTAPFWLILLSFTRLGCFTSNCCGSRQFFINGTLVYLPVQLLDSICSLVLLWLCFRAEAKEDGTVLGVRPFQILLIGYGICRFLIEFSRTNKPLALGLTISQYHCIFFIVVGILMTVHYHKHPQNPSETVSA